jgi:poly(3-hydroxybutyrate) depolymerase
VTLYTVTDGGHTIPNPTKKALFILGRTNRNISAAEKIWHTMTSAANS